MVALQNYQAVLSSNADFLQAQDHIDAIEGEQEMGGSTQAVIGVEIVLPPSGSAINILNEHTLLLNENIDSYFIPGLDAREPAPEIAIRAGPIPVPPPPPPRSGGQ